MERERKISTSDKMTYEEFKTKIIHLLTDNQTGLTWTSIKEKLQLPQAVPNNQWVLRLSKRNWNGKVEKMKETHSGTYPTKA